MTDAERIDAIANLDAGEIYSFQARLEIRWLAALTNRQAAEIERLREKGLRLCQELQCPAMEYLAPEIQQAWSNLFNYLEAKP